MVFHLYDEVKTIFFSQYVKDVSNHGRERLSKSSVIYLNTLLQQLGDSKYAILGDKIRRVYRTFEKCVQAKGNVTLAYSGGKDSTILAVLFYRWLEERRIEGLTVNILHNDTASEIGPMEIWARRFMDDYAEKLQELGHQVNIIVTTPPPRDTFYWRVIVRGYPAPTFNFRWCVKLLKILPTRNSLNEISRGVLLTGLRESESRARLNSFKFKYGNCGSAPGKCHAYYFSTEDIGGMKKVAPIRDWTNTDVWHFLKNIQDFKLDDLLFLYACEEARYGCWHCTLVKIQWGLRVLPKNYHYFDAARILYRKLSDLSLARLKKDYGYSSLGPLNTTGRAIMLYMFKAAEELSQLKLYGLDDVKVNEGYTLRQIFYEVDPTEAMEIIIKNDPNISSKRIVNIAQIRNTKINAKSAKSILIRMKQQIISHKGYLSFNQSILGSIVELLQKIQDFFDGD